VRIANADGRAAVVRDGSAFDINTASKGRFSADPQAVFEEWAELRRWEAATPMQPADGVALESLVAAGVLGSPAPRPRQVFGIGLNYKSHAIEANLPLPEFPVVFTKFPSCLTGPYADLPLLSDTVDWEAELVVVVGEGGSNVAASQAWERIAGIAVGQDISDRIVQTRPPVPQFSLGKSFPGFGPFGPVLVTADEFADPDDLELTCSVNGTTVQRARTSDMIFSVPELISYVSSIVQLLPGDVIFTGTPAGVGGGRDPQWYLRDGDLLETGIAGVGAIRQRCVRSSSTAAVSAATGSSV